MINRQSPSALGLWAIFSRNENNNKTLTHSFISVIHQAFIKHLLCAKHIANPGNTEMNRAQPLPLRSSLWTEEPACTWPWMPGVRMCPGSRSSSPPSNCLDFHQRGAPLHSPATSETGNLPGQAAVTYLSKIHSLPNYCNFLMN